MLEGQKVACTNTVIHTETTSSERPIFPSLLLIHPTLALAWEDMWTIAGIGTGGKRLLRTGIWGLEALRNQQQPFRSREKHISLHDMGSGYSLPGVR